MGLIVLAAVTMLCASCNCMAVGSYKLSRRSVRKTIAEHWNGSRWQIIPTPNP